MIINTPDGMNRLQLATIKIGLEAELRGMRLTSRAPACFSIIRKEFGIKVPRHAQGKRMAYEEFCNKFGFEIKNM